MPEGYTHVRTAKRAAATLKFPVTCPEAFAAGANGPDSLFCYEAWKSGAKRRMDLPKLGSRMHRERTGAFLLALVQCAETRAQKEYVLGFLSHYATDTTLHPYVEAVQQPGQPYDMEGGHGYFEIALDSTLHARDTGVSGVPAQDVCPMIPGDQLAEICVLLQKCLRQVFAEDVPVEYLADAFYHSFQLRKLFVSRHGLRYKLFALLEPMMGGRGHITGHISPRQMAAKLPETWVDAATGETRQGGPFALLKRAQERSVYYMCAALTVWQGNTSLPQLGEMLGSMDYGTGTETELSKQSASENH